MKFLYRHKSILVKAKVLFLYINYFELEELFLYTLLEKMFRMKEIIGYIKIWF